MESKQLILSALKRQAIDRIPVVPHGYGEPFLRRYFDSSIQEPSKDQDVRYNPNLNLVEAQLTAHKRFGFDPLIWMTLKPAPSEWGTWADDWVIHKWDGITCNSWCLRENLLEINGNNKRYQYIIETPKGELTCQIENELGHTRWILDNPLKNENDIDLLPFRPDPSQLPIVESVNSQLDMISDDGIGIVHVPGVWHQACDLRGINQLIFDIYDRPEWVDKLFGILRDYLAEFIRVLSTSKLEVLILNESNLGVGVSPSIFNKHIFPADQVLIDTAKRNGLTTIFHNCGKSHSLLEGMSDTGTDAVETLAPRTVGGDVELSDAKHRIGHKVCLRGGMDTGVIEKGTPEQIYKEVKRCLEAAAKGGGYILGPVNPIYEAPFENLEYFAGVAKQISSNYL